MSDKEKVIKLVEEKIPEFAKNIKERSEPVLFHQLAFAEDFQEDELFLLGNAIKYAGIYGRTVIINGYKI